MSKTVIIYNRRDKVSIVAKNKAKRETPNALVIESSNKEALREALAGSKNVVNCDLKLDKRHLKADKVKEGAPKQAPPKKNKTIAEKVLEKMKGAGKKTANEVVDLMPKKMNASSNKSSLSELVKDNSITKTESKGVIYYKAK